MLRYLLHFSYDVKIAHFFFFVSHLQASVFLIIKFFLDPGWVYIMAQLAADLKQFVLEVINHNLLDQRQSVDKS